MNKTISINLGGRNFFIEEDAFQKLDGYLKAIKQHFSEYSGSEEIVADMESRIAEKFGEKFKDDNQAVITAANVESLIAELGTVEDIAGEEGKKEQAYNASSNAKQSFAPKRLMRNGDDKIIAGVCSGIAAYFEIDPFIVRAVFGLLIFAWGAIVPIYFLLWIIMPEAKTPTEKMQMRGEPLNLGTISETIKERAEEFKERVIEVKDKQEWKQWGKDLKDRAKNMGEEAGAAGKQGGRGFGNFLGQIFRGLGKIISMFVKILVKIISLSLVIAFAAAVAGLTLAITFAIFNINSPYIGLPVLAIAHTAPFYILIIAAYVIALVPLMFLLLSAVSLFTGRSSFRTGIALSLFGVWFLALIVAGSVGGRYVPQYVEEVKNSPQFQTVNKSFDAKDFNKLELFSSINYKLVEGKDFSVKATGWAGDLDRLDVKVNNGTLNIDKNYRNHFCIFCISESPTVEITAPAFAVISAHNSSSVESDSLTATSTELTLTNSSDANINFVVKDLSVYLTNSSDASLSGSATTLTAKLRNSSDLDARELVVKDALITTLNSSDALVNATSTLTYNIFNSSQIYYLGTPQLINNGEPSTYQNPPLPMNW